MDALSKLLGALAARTGWTGSSLGVRVRLRARWGALAGPLLAAHSRLVLEGRRVVIEVDDPRWGVQVEGLSDLLRARLEAEAGPLDAIDVRVVPSRAKAPSASPDAGPRLRTVTLAPAVAAAVEHIPDRGLKERFRALALEAAARRSAQQ